MHSHQLVTIVMSWVVTNECRYNLLQCLFTVSTDRQLGASRVSPFVALLFGTLPLVPYFGVCVCVCVCVCAAPKFMEALKDEGMVDEESLSEAHLSTAYSKLQEQVADNIARQNQIMPRVEVRGGWGVGRRDEGVGRKWVGEMKDG